VGAWIETNERRVVCRHLPGAPTPLQITENIPLNSANLAILREKRFKLVHFNSGLPPLLYDLENDPGEFGNLANEPARQATLLRLTQKLLSHRMSHADRTLSAMEVRAGGVLNYRPGRSAATAGPCLKPLPQPARTIRASDGRPHHGWC